MTKSEPNSTKNDENAVESGKIIYTIVPEDLPFITGIAPRYSTKYEVWFMIGNTFTHSPLDQKVKLLYKQIKISKR